MKLPILLDTKPLLLLLKGLLHKNYVSKSHIWQGYSQQEFEFFFDYIKRFKGIMIVPQVLAECANLINQDNKEAYSYTLQQIIQPLKECFETYIEKETILHHNKFPSFGPTDIALFECCKKTGSLLLTSEFALKKLCDGYKIPALNVDEIRYYM